MVVAAVVALAGIAVASRAFLAGGRDDDVVATTDGAHAEALDLALAQTGGLFDECRPKLGEDAIGVIHPPVDVGWYLEPLEARCRGYVRRTQDSVVVDLVVATPPELPLPDELSEGETRGLSIPPNVAPAEISRWTFLVRGDSATPVVPRPGSGIGLDDSDGLGSIYRLPCDVVRGEHWCAAVGFVHRDGRWRRARGPDSGSSSEELLVGGIRFFGPSASTPVAEPVTMASGQLNGGSWVVRVYQGREDPGIEFVVDGGRVVATQLSSLPRDCTVSNGLHLPVPHEPRLSGPGVVFGIAGPAVEDVIVELPDGSVAVEARAVPPEIGRFQVFASELRDIGVVGDIRPGRC